MTWLVIGVGNTLRRDDGLGPWLAERVAAWGLPGVTTRVVHQLMPELAIDISGHDGVLFLDASASAQISPIIEVAPVANSQGWGHTLNPGELLALANCFEARARKAFLVPVPGSDFEFGEGLSDAAQQAGERVLTDIRRLLREDALCTKSA